MFSHIHQQLLQSAQAAQAAQRQHQQPMQSGLYRGGPMHHQMNNMMEPSMTPPGQHQRPVSWNMSQMPFGMPPQIPVPYDTNPGLPNEMYKLNMKTVRVPTSCVGIVIGRGGETTSDLRNRSGATIRVTPDREASPDDDEWLIYITGQQVQVDLAHSLVNDVINEGLSRSYRDGFEPHGEHGELPEVAEEATATKDDSTTHDEATAGEHQGPVCDTDGDPGGHHGNGEDTVDHSSAENDGRNDKTGV